MDVELAHIVVPPELAKIAGAEEDDYEDVDALEALDDLEAILRSARRRRRRIGRR